MNRKQVGQKKTQKVNGTLKKKINSQQNGVDDLATHEEEALNVMFQKQEFQIPRQKQIQLAKEDEDDDEEDDYNVDDIKRSSEKKQNQDKMSEIVLSLFHKNKINDKNAFDIPLINIKDLSVFLHTEGDNAWKQISANLDAGSKIYGYRVDMVHQNTYKVLGGIHRTATNFDETNQADQENEQEQIKKRKIVNTGGEATLEKNPANLDTNKYDVEFEIDPLFQQTSAKFDEAGAKGLLLNNLSISENLVLGLDSELMTDNAQNDVKCQNNNSNLDAINILRHNLKSILNSELCPELSQFRQEILTRGQELFDLKNLGTSFNDVLRGNPQMKMEYDEQQEFMIDDQIQDEQMFMQEVDFIAGDREVLDSQTKLRRDLFNELAQERQDLTQIDQGQFQEENFLQQQNQEQLEVQKQPQQTVRSFNLLQFDQAVLQIGTGRVFQSEVERQNWMQFQMGSNTLMRKGNGVQLSKTQKQKKKEELPFSFKMQDDEEEVTRDIFQKRQKEVHQPNMDYKQLYLLPRAYQVEKQNFLDLFQRSCRFEGNTQKCEEFVEIVDDNQEGILPERFEDFAQNLQNNNLMNRSDQRMTIPIKELKQKMWSALSKKIPSTSSKEGLEFSHVSALLPSILPDPKMKVSIQTCFVTLLHLANEENLRFTQQANESDFIIQKDYV